MKKKSFIVSCVFLGVFVIMAPAGALPTNWALSGVAVATQSSTWKGVASADRAIDGNTDGILAHGSVAVTYPTSPTWWQVDLQEVRAIDQIVLWNRTDAASHRLTNFTVSILNESTDVPLWSEVFFPTGGTFVPSLCIDFADTIVGQFVKIQLTNPNYLQLAEVQVWGNAISDDAGASASHVPEPGTIFMLGAGLLGLLALRRRRVK